MMTIAEMKAINAAKGYHFFDKESMRFWGSRIHAAPNKYGFFIESHDNFDRTRKLFTVRFFAEKTGRVCDCIEPADIAATYEHFSTLTEARAFRDKLTNALDDAKKCYREKEVLTAIDEIMEEGFNSGIFKVKSGDKYILINTNNFDRFICG